jgi:hypothetical protein
MFWVKISIYFCQFWYSTVGAVSPQLILGCRWYALLLARSVNTQLALCGAGSGALDVTGRRFVAMAGRLVIEVG